MKQLAVFSVALAWLCGCIPRDHQIGDLATQHLAATADSAERTDAAPPAPVSEPVPVRRFPARVELNPHRTSRVWAPVPGRLSRLHVSVGDSVKAGQVVAELESVAADQAVASLEQADAARAHAQARVRQAADDLARVTELVRADALPAKEALAAETERTGAQAELTQAAAAVTQAKERLRNLGLAPGVYGQRIAVTAPAAGKVLDLKAGPGELVNDVASPLMLLSDVDRLWVTAEFPESHPVVRTGQSCFELTVPAHPGLVIRGQTWTVADTVDPVTRTVTLRTEVSGVGGRLRPHMYAELAAVSCATAPPRSAS